MLGYMMDNSVEELLQKGIIAHEAGELAEAHKYYTSILEEEPQHANANHNMGVLGFGLGNFQGARLFFRSALDIDSNNKQYWISYIETLIKLGQMEEAQTSFAEAWNKGISGDTFDNLEKKIYSKP